MFRLSHNYIPKIISQDDCLPMYVEKASERDSVIDTVWLLSDERQQLQSWGVYLLDMSLELTRHPITPERLFPLAYHGLRRSIWFAKTCVSLFHASDIDN